MGIAKCSKLAAVASSFGSQICWSEELGEKINCLLTYMLWLRNLPAMGTKRTLGILFGSLVSWMRWAVLPRRGDRRTGVASIAVGTWRRGSVGVIGGTVPGTLLRVMRRRTLFCRLQRSLRRWIWCIHYGRCV